MRRNRLHLEKHFDPDTARQLDALIEGLTLHRALAREPHGRALTLEAIARITAPALYHAHREPSGVDGRAGGSS